VPSKIFLNEGRADPPDATMIKAFPASNTSVDVVAREAAKEAARRAGVTLGEYLNRVIAEQAAELGFEPHDPDATARLQALTARLMRPPTAGLRPHPRTRPGRDRELWRTRGGSLEKTALQITDGRSPARDDYPAPDVLSDLTEDAAVRPGDLPLASLAEQLAEIEHRLLSNGGNQLIRAALARLERDLSARRGLDGGLAESELKPLESDITMLLHALRSTPSQNPAARSGQRDAPAPSGSNRSDRTIGSAQAGAATEPPRSDPPSAWQTSGENPQRTDEHDPVLNALDQNLTALAQQLGQAMIGADNPPEPRDVAHEVQQIARAEDHIQTAALQQQLTELSRALAEFSPQAAIGALETAIQQLAVKIDASTDPRLRESLVAPVETIAADLRNMLRSADSRSIIEGLDHDVKAIACKIETLVADLQPKASEQLRELRDGLTILNAKPMPFDRIEQKLVALAERVQSLAADGASRVAIGQIMSALDAVNRQLGANAPAAALKHIDQQMAALASRIDQVAVPSQKAIEDLSKRLDTAHQSLAARIEAARPPIVDTKGVETMMAALAGKFDATAAAEARSLSALDAQIGKISARIERLAAEGASRADTAELAASLAEVRRSIAATAPADSMLILSKRIDGLAAKVNEVLLTSPNVAKSYEDLTRRLDSQIAKVAERIERLASESAPRASATQLAASLEELRKSVAASAPTESLQALTKRIDILAGKVDEVLVTAPTVAHGYEELTKRIAAVHHSLAARLDMPPAAPAPIEPTGLETMVRALAAKIDAVLPADIEPRSLDSIEAQVSRIAEKLDRSDNGLVSLASLQRSILDLFSQLEETRHAALDAAETAARTAARDTLREVMLNAPTPPEKSEPENRETAEQIHRQLTEMRTLQDNSDRRVHSTLSAVHGTLEKIAGRLAAINDQAEHPNRPPATPQGTGFRSDFATPELRPSGFESVLDILAKAVERHTPGTETASKTQTVSTAHEADRDDDFLIEPGAGYGLGHHGDTAPKGSGHASFIAAARRAAQAAAAESVVSAKRSSAPAPNVDPPAAKPKAWFAGYNLKLLLGLGCLAAVSVSVIAYQLAYGSLLSADVTPVQFNAAAKPDAAAIATAAPNTSSPKTAEIIAASTSSKELLPTGDNAKIAVKATAFKAGASANEDAAGATLSPMSPMTPPSAQPLEGTGSIMSSQPMSGSPSSLGDAAQAGNPAAQYELGTRFADGRDVNRDLKAAALWFEKAATQGLAPAQFRLGTIYEKGLGVQRDEAIAKLWYQRAGERGNAHAMHNLAVLTAEGSSSKPDYPTAAIWFRKAAELGVRDSQYNLAILYARGLGIEQSLVQSYAWFSLAAAQGDEDAAKKRDEVAARLDAPSLDAAKALVAQFRAKVPDPGANEVMAPAAGWGAIGSKLEQRSPIRMPAKPKVSRL
jgi:localization factor PodJL